MVSDEKLERFLSSSSMAWEIVPRDRHISLSNEWVGLYGNCLDFGRRIRHKHGAKAQVEYSEQSAKVFLIVPFLADKGGPHSIRKPGPRMAAYECRGDGKLPDLAVFADTDFFIVPPDMSWTMIHTHEDYGFGGPYSVHKEWLVPTTRKLSR